MDGTCWEKACNIGIENHLPVKYQYYEYNYIFTLYTVIQCTYIYIHYSMTVYMFLYIQFGFMVQQHVQEQTLAQIYHRSTSPGCFIPATCCGSYFNILKVQKKQNDVLRSLSLSVYTQYIYIYTVYVICMYIYIYIHESG